MIAFRHIKSGKYMSRLPVGRDFQTVALLADAMPYAPGDEEWLRRTYLGLAEYHTVTFSTRIDHPSNDLARLSPEELAARHPIAPAAMAWGNRSL